MNKKDIIIAAMLINSILLLGVFAFSKKNPNRRHEMAFPKVAKAIPLPAAPSKPREPIAKVEKKAKVAKAETKKTIPIPAKKKAVTVPKKEKKVAVKPTTPKVNVAKKTVATGPVYYTVQAGENPWVIAKKNHIKVDALLKLNNLNKQSAKKIRPGDKLRIR